MRPVLISLCAATLLASPVLASPVLADDSAAPKKERPICRKAQAATGSHRPGKRICLTAAEWKARDGGADEYALPDQRIRVSGIHSN